MKTKSVSVVVLMGALAAALCVCGPLSEVRADDAKDGLCSSPIAKLIMGNVGRLLVLRSELNITDSQRSQMKGVIRSNKDAIRPAVRTLLEKRQAFVETVMDKPGDEPAIRATGAELGKAIGDTGVVASKVLKEVRATLTEKQQELIKKFRKSLHESALEWTRHIGE